jgi:hypothetical protein
MFQFPALLSLTLDAVTIALYFENKGDKSFLDELLAFRASSFLLVVFSGMWKHLS